MREIKFRAWIFGGLDEGEQPFMTPVRIIQWDEAVGPIIEWWDHREWSAQPEFYLMQKTGLRDRHGVDIYEGDIVHDDSNIPMEVYWDESRGAGGFSMWSCVSDDTMFYEPELEVIGNIYENPEPLNADKERTHGEI